jgi:hypothetical protein
MIALPSRMINSPSRVVKCISRSWGGFAAGLGVWWLTTPAEHAALLHPDAEGYDGLVTLAQRVQGQWQETSLKLPELPWALRELAGAPEAYLTQNRFKGARRIAYLWQLNALWTDLEYHKAPQWQGKSPESMWQLAKDVLEDARLPRPTLVIATGRGLVLIWVRTPIPRPALPRWNAFSTRFMPRLSR